MAIIGYDDNYTYQYCRLDSTTSNDLTNCDNIVSGKGAFILKNSWGNSYPYPYLAYTSNVNGSYGITGVSKKIGILIMILLRKKKKFMGIV